MGNYTRLLISSRCEFEAKNCLPVTWHPLFDPQDFLIVTRQEEPYGEEVQWALYRTSAGAALERVAQVIGRLRGHTPAWTFLRPLEILRDELGRCAPDELVELDVTPLAATNDVLNRRVAQAPAAFARMLQALSGDPEKDLAVLNELVGQYSLAKEVSLTDLGGEERMFLLIGTYWGDAERDAFYTLEYFGVCYRRADS